MNFMTPFNTISVKIEAARQFYLYRTEEEKNFGGDIVTHVKRILLGDQPIEKGKWFKIAHEQQIPLDNPPTGLSELIENVKKLSILGQVIYCFEWKPDDGDYIALELKPPKA